MLYRQLIQHYHCLSCDKPLDLMPTGWVCHGLSLSPLCSSDSPLPNIHDWSPWLRRLPLTERMIFSICFIEGKILISWYSKTACAHGNVVQRLQSEKLVWVVKLSGPLLIQNQSKCDSELRSMHELFRSHFCWKDKADISVKVEQSCILNSF